MVALLHPQPHQPSSRRRRTRDGRPFDGRAIVERPDGGGHLTLVPGSRVLEKQRASADGSPAAWLQQLDRRIVGGVAAIIVAFMALSLVQGGPPADAGVGNKAQAVSELQAGESVVVAVSGDTYWQIASTLVVDGDIRPVVQQLVDRNGNANLQIGQRVIIPAEFG